MGLLVALIGPDGSRRGNVEAASAQSALNEVTNCDSVSRPVVAGFLRFSPSTNEYI